MLIQDNKLDPVAFKEFFPSLSWMRLPRKLGPDHEEFFYVGSYEDDEKKVQVVLRPSLNMSISESFKNRMPQNGLPPDAAYRGPLVDWGFYVEVKASDSFFEAVKKAAMPMPIKTQQVLEW